ncbi:hypothetical protein L1049_019463 [Liquidambar formosana]|uniref:NB-ARC domain-containing protein n=1 Tax=Liquidambar formosana TaxID=63359 RepID=A0AAP0SBN9_LIQFO
MEPAVFLLFNVEDLIKKLEELGFLIGRVEQSIQAATNNVYNIQPELKTWQNKTRCFNGLHCNLKSRYQLSKKAKKTATAILLTIQAGEKFNKSDNVSYPVPPQGIGSTPIKGYEAFESRMLTLNEVMEALKDPIINMIGVSRIGGVGKTMLVTELARKVKEDKLFDQVVMVVVSQTPNIRKIQEDIAYPLGLIFDDMEIDSQRKDRLYRRLKNEKSILVILDDIWEKLDLETVGIPSGDDHKGCDIVEAHELKPTATEIAQECVGLPVAIAAMANALKIRVCLFGRMPCDN